jgi:hypothetical protein
MKICESWQHVKWQILPVSVRDVLGAVTTTTTIAQSSGVPWDEVSALAACVTALGLVAASIAAFWAGKQVRESERSRHAEMATHMSGRWASEELTAARKALHGRGGRVGIRNSYLAVTRDDGTAEAGDETVHSAAQTIMRFFEDLGVMERQGGLGLSWIQLTMASSVLVYWRGLDLTVIALRRLLDQPTAYENFEDLSYQLAHAKPPKAASRPGRRGRQRRRRAAFA